MAGGGRGGSEESLSDQEDGGGGMEGAPMILALGNEVLSSSVLEVSGKAA